MNFNKLIGLSIISLLAFGMQSCSNDFLNEINPNEAVEETFWTSAENAEAAMASLYSPLRGQMYGYFGAFTGFQTMNRGDDVWFVLGEEPHNMEPVLYTNTPETEESDFGRLYLSINRANVFLEHLDDIDDMEEEEREELRSEAHFIRGFTYFLLVINYGNVPLRTKSASDNSDLIMKASSPEEEVWGQVIKDFKAAKENLPVKRSNDELGRASKGAAKAYLGKSYVYTKQYELAEKELGDLLQAPYDYELVDDFDDNFTEFAEFNKESVFEFNYNGAYGGGGVWAGEGGSQGSILSQFVGSDGTGGWGKFLPSASIVRDFIKEERPDDAGTRFDKRMYTSFFWEYSDYENDLTDEKWFGNMTFDELWTGTRSKRERGAPDFPEINGNEGRFIIKKFTNFYKNEDDANSMYDADNTNNNLRVMRFAEVLLLHAEACIKTGNLSAASEDLSRIRDRAGLKEKTWAGEQELWAEMIHQNELEFFFEGHRFFDLTRWYDYDEMKQVLLDNNAQGAKNFEAKNYYLPIPQNELNTNTELEQHPLWQ